MTPNQPSNHSSQQLHNHPSPQVWNPNFVVNSPSSYVSFFLKKSLK